MSEFSDSYHMKSNHRENAVKLIENSGNKGFVFEEANGWVTFLIEGPAYDINESVMSWNPGLIVHYMYAEDHGWELRIFNKDEIVFEYKCDWTDEISTEKEIFDIDIIKELIVQQGNPISNLEELFDLRDFDYEESPAYKLAELIGLVNYEWVSADYFSKDELNERVIFVD
ncbi:hypothetical protein SAMN04487969_116113 [Paenibacillus algorifonticola]|uniref:Uncharacterized protein n=1 Tax=Paenibacillus algorifonticola TaxID=684063 RepID=A0A1I2GJ07_9BACL|nr:hypothetical protein [Paenibacillus algorifonticola]SFF17492.1 hypothetical protein SAMN04487969_116113 [Paenibacillus algorifonticola]